MKQYIINEIANPEIESEVIRQVKDYITHCKKFDAPCNTSDCIEFIAENMFTDYETIENEFGALIIDILHIMTDIQYNEPKKIKLENCKKFMEAYRILRENGYDII